MPQEKTAATALSALAQDRHRRVWTAASLGMAALAAKVLGLI